jgi:hypothetical protein
VLVVRGIDVMWIHGLRGRVQLRGITIPVAVITGRTATTKIIEVLVIAIPDTPYESIIFAIGRAAEPIQILKFWRYWKRALVSSHVTSIGH